MVSIYPLKKALIPVSTEAAKRISGPNYDEFQGDEEIQNLIKQNPDVVLRVTMAHCDATSPTEILKEGSSEALEHAAKNMQELIDSDLTKIEKNILYIYEMEDPKRPSVRQIGLGCMARTDEIRTKENPGGNIIRNEGVREKKARARADMVEKTQAFIGTVNNGIADRSGKITERLESYADSRECNYSVVDQKDNTHKVWIISEKKVLDEFVNLFKAAPEAYVADGNHRSAAALMLGLETFLTVFFVADRMRIDPYHRLIKDQKVSKKKLIEGIEKNFEVEELDGLTKYQPEKIHEIGMYIDKNWYKLTVKPSAYNSADAVQSIDADIVQTRIFNEIMGIKDAADENFTYVGGDRGSKYLKEKVDTGEFDFAIAMAPVTMGQFIEVCNQNKFMPPKSTWFEPKLRSGLVVELL
ncbi:MAG: DUF1015 family protein [Patescibacteria group bacterium]|nr:DUF1015 family protein [Patescibacteria group bacterium]